MPNFTITVSDAALAKLKVLVDSYNQNQGTALTVQEWLLLHLKEVLISQELGAAVDVFRKKAETDANEALSVALQAERQRLIDAL